MKAVEISVENFNYSNLKSWIEGYTHKEKVELAIHCAEIVIDLYTGPSDAPKIAIQTAKNWVLNPSEENRDKCDAAAVAADDAADDAVDADDGDTYAAAAAAYAAAATSDNFTTSTTATAATAAATAAADAAAYGDDDDAAAAYAAAAAAARKEVEESIVKYIKDKIASIKIRPAVKVGKFKVTIEGVNPTYTKDMHGSGELPPVGSFFDVDGNDNCDDGLCHMRCIAHHVDAGVIGEYEVNGDKCFQNIIAGFKPAKTEREKAVEDMKKTLKPFVSTGMSPCDKLDISLGQIYDAGYRKC